MNRITKLVVLFLAFSLTVILAQESLAVGFSKGNAFVTTPIHGTVSVQCFPQPGYPGGPNYQWISCDAILWSPDIADYFLGPQGVQANKVKLIATHQDGSQRDKSSDYDSSQSRSKSEFNLGIHTLTQKPLLKGGMNHIHYILSQNDQTVTQGDFDVTVTGKQEVQCPVDSVVVSGPYDCNDQIGICDRYFQQNNYCQ